MIIVLPSGNDHLADALVRDLGFVKAHVDEPVRRVLLDIDPFVEATVQIANLDRGPRLSSRLERNGGDWAKAMNRCPEIERLLAALRPYAPAADITRDTVVVGVETSSQRDSVDRHVVIAVDGSPLPSGTYPSDDDVMIVSAGDVVEQQRQIVEFVKGLGEPAKASAAAE